MDRAEQIKMQLYAAFRRGDNATDTAVARIVALEELCRDILDTPGDLKCLELRERIEELLPTDPAMGRIIQQINDRVAPKEENNG